MSVSSLAQLYNHPIIRSVEESICQGSCVTKWKIIFGVILFLEGLLFGHLVLLIRRVKSNNSTSRFNTILTFGSALSAGVFLATGLLHTLPEAIGLLSGKHNHGAEEDHVDHREEDHHDPDEEDHGHNEEGEEEHHHSEEEEEHISFPTAFLVVIISFYAFFFLEKILLPKIFGSKVGHTHADAEVDESLNEEELEDGQLGKKEIESQSENGRFFSKAFTMGLFKILGISAHSFIESMAIGIASNFSLSLNIFIATVAHRWATAVAITFPLARNLRYIPFLTLLLLFSAMVPLGIGVGSALSSLSSQVQGILFSVSVGTFLYMGAYELMVDAFVENTKWQFAKFLTTILGFGIMVSITAVLIAFDIHG